jgi:23S rRNA (uracil1939-C5)-methyltransferase
MPLSASVVVSIDRIAAGGDGVGRLPDGRVVFVPRTAPGDQAVIEIARERARFAQARLVGLRVAGPDRVEPRCLHYDRDRCGGCQLQHLAPAAQREARRRIVGDALRRLGRLEVEAPPLEPAPDAWGYRTRVVLARGRGGRIGFHRFDQPGAVFDLVRCEVAAPAINELWPRVAERRRLLPRTLDHLAIRTDRRGAGHLIVETVGGDAWSGGPVLRRELEREGNGPTMWWKPAGGAARVVAGGDDAYPAVAFEQVNPVMGDRVRRYAVEALAPAPGARAWDLYAGIGETADLLARRGAEVESVELDRRAVEEAGRRQEAAGLRIRRHAGRVEAVVPALEPAWLAVANPPRGGLAPELIATLAARPPERLAYVSCDPATLARDLGRLVLAGPYRLAELRAFDLFPQTAHVETVAVLELR